MKIICTICSHNKKESLEPLSAGDRYTGAHIALVKAVARDLKLPLYFLSGKYGLIAEDMEIPHYDYYLEDNAVNTLIPTVAEQIRNSNISEIEFYSEDKASWAPHKRTIEIAAQEAGVIFCNNSIS